MNYGYWKRTGILEKEKLNRVIIGSIVEKGLPL